MTQVNEILNSSSKIPTIFINNYFFQGFFKNLSKERTPSELLLKKFTNIRRTFLLLTSVVAPIVLDLLSLPLTVKLSKPNKTIELRRRNEQKKGVRDITFLLTPPISRPLYAAPFPALGGTFWTTSKGNMSPLEIHVWEFSVGKRDALKFLQEDKTMQRRKVWTYKATLL